MIRSPIRRSALILAGLLVPGLMPPGLILPGLTPAPAAAQEAQKREPNSRLAGALPDVPKGWTADEPQLAGGVLAMYTALSAERVYRRGPVAVTVAAARSPTLVSAIRGSITTPANLPPASRVGMVAKQRAVIVESQQPHRIIIQIPVGVSGLAMLSTDTATLDEVMALAAGIDYSDLGDR